MHFGARLINGLIDFEFIKKWSQLVIHLNVTLHSYVNEIHVSQLDCV